MVHAKVAFIHSLENIQVLFKDVILTLQKLIWFWCKASRNYFIILDHQLPAVYLIQSYLYGVSIFMCSSPLKCLKSPSFYNCAQFGVMFFMGMRYYGVFFNLLLRHVCLGLRIAVLKLHC